MSEPILNELQQNFNQVMDQKPNAEGEKYTYRLAEMWAKKDQADEFLIPDLLPSGRLSVLLGEDGIGKTQFLIQMALHVAMKLPSFMNLKLNSKHHNALFVATEDSQKGFITAAAKQALAINPDVKPEDIGIDFTEAVDFSDFNAFTAEILKNIVKTKYDLIVIDAFSDLFGLINGDINDNTAARQLLQVLQKIAETNNLALIIIHHVPKGKMIEKLKLGKIFIEKNDAQGASANTQKPRHILALTHDKKSITSEGLYHDNFLHVVKTNTNAKTYFKRAIQMGFDASTLLHSYKAIIDIESFEEGLAAGGVQKPNAPEPIKTKIVITYEEHLTHMRTAFGKMDKLTYDMICDRMKGIYGVGYNKIKSNDGLLSQVLGMGIVVKFGKEYVLAHIEDPGFGIQATLIPPTDEDAPF